MSATILHFPKEPLRPFVIRSGARDRRKGDRRATSELPRPVNRPHVLRIGVPRAFGLLVREVGWVLPGGKRRMRREEQRLEALAIVAARRG